MNIYDVPELQQYLNPQGLDSLYTSPTYISKQNVDPFFQPPLPFNNPTYLMKQQLGMVPTGIMTQAPLKNLGFDTTFGVANEPDQEDTNKDTETKTGIAKLFDFLSNFIPGIRLLKRLNESGGIAGLNQRLRNTDFGRAKTLADYFDMKKYGGYEGREDARAATMAQARGIQKKIDAGDFGTASAQDKARGQMPSRTTSAPKRSSSFDSSARGKALHG